MRSFFDVAPEISKNVPMLIGSVSEEGNRCTTAPPKTSGIGNSEAYGEDKATALIAGLEEGASREEHPDVVVHVQRCFRAEQLAMRNNIVNMAKLKHELKAAPAYAYYFTWQSPMLEALPAHGTPPNLQFCFDNTKRCEQGTGNTPEAQALAKKMADGMGQFCANRQSQSTRTELDADRSGSRPDHGLGQPMPHGG